MINFIEVYEGAVALFDDPKITVQFRQNPISFYKTMFPYLQDAIFQFNNPAVLGYKLANYTSPEGYTEEFVGDGTTTTFELSTTPTENAIIHCELGNEIVEAEYEETTRIITLNTPVGEGESLKVEWYDCGHFNSDFNGLVAPNIYDFLIQSIKGITAHLMVKSWATNEKNFLLDIQRLLNDGDFKLFSESSTVKSKMAWVNDIDRACQKMQTQLAWNLQFSRASTNRRW